MIVVAAVVGVCSSFAGGGCGGGKIYIYIYIVVPVAVITFVVADADAVVNAAVQFCVLQFYNH